MCLGPSGLSYLPRYFFTISSVELLSTRTGPVPHVLPLEVPAPSSVRPAGLVPPLRAGPTPPGRLRKEHEFERCPPFCNTTHLMNSLHDLYVSCDCGLCLRPRLGLSSAGPGLVYPSSTPRLPTTNNRMPHAPRGTTNLGHHRVTAAARKLGLTMTQRVFCRRRCTEGRCMSGSFAHLAAILIDVGSTPAACSAEANAALPLAW